MDVGCGDDWLRGATQYSTWIGGSILAGLSTFKKVSDDYDWPVLRNLSNLPDLPSALPPVHLRDRCGRSGESLESAEWLSRWVRAVPGTGCRLTLRADVGLRGRVQGRPGYHPQEGVLMRGVTPCDWPRHVIPGRTRLLQDEWAERPPSRSDDPS
jgi:hypothetical protein